MTGRGRCKRPRKSMAGDRDTAELKKNVKDCSNPKLEENIADKPLDNQEITKPPLYPIVQLDLYTQARKALSFRSPFDSEDSPATQPLVSSANNLPTGVSNLLNRHSDNRKRHKKLHSGTEKKSSTTAKPRGSNIWIETEEYFRELILDDVERLEKLSSIELSNDDKCLLIPILDDDRKLLDHDGTHNGGFTNACGKYNAKFEDCVGSRSSRMVNCNGTMSYQNGRSTMDEDGDGVEKKGTDIKPKHNLHSCQNSEKHFNSFSGLEWLLGSRSKIYLASERPSKKRKVLGRDAGLEKLFIAHPVEGLESVCHYCCCGDMGNPLNCLIKCSSCGVVVHQRCYGVQADVDTFWLCSWCKWKNVLELITETPCLLCPKKGGALKPVGRRGLVSENEGSEMEFAHLFCCLWVPEVYLENTRNMEPIMNMDESKDTKKKLICSLCKVNYGTCVRCSNGSCRTSFHPSCAREAKQRLEIWGKLGSDEVELRCFCSKHSEIECDSSSQDTGDTSLADEEHLKENDKKLETNVANGDILHSVAAEYSVYPENDEANASSALKFTSILMKLIDLGEVSAEVVASEIGVSSDSISAILTDKHIPPDLQCKLVRWLKKRANVRNWQKNLKQKIRSLVEPRGESDANEYVCSASLEKPSDPDTIPAKSIPHLRRTKSSMMQVTDCMSSTCKDKTHDDRHEGDADLEFTSEDVIWELEKILCDTDNCVDIEENNNVRTKAEVQDVAQCLAEDVVFQDSKLFWHMTSSPFLKIGDVNYASHVHPLIYKKYMKDKTDLLQRNSHCESAVLRDREASQSEASSSSGLCCNNHNLLATSADRTSGCQGVDLDKLVSTGYQNMLKLSPADEVEEELVYYQQKLIDNAIVRKHISDELISTVVGSLPRDTEIAGRRKWDAVLVNQYNHDLREAKKQGRKERRHKEAQAVLAAATAAAAASSRISSTRKDNLEDSSQQEDLLKMKVSDSRTTLQSQIPRSAATRSSSDRNSDFDHFASGISRNHARTCDICSRSDTVLNPVLVCSSCKVSVHLDCYRSVKNTSGPWHCELCEDLISSRGSGALAANYWEKPYFVAECSLCGGTAGAFRKSGDGQWIHALCAEWILESTYRRGQVNPIEGKDIACREAEVCIVCHRRQGVCLKCSYGHCQTTFHPTCARSAGFYMTVRTNGGKLQHKAYCEKHSVEQRAKADNQRHGIEEFKGLKQLRVELERLRLLCERLVKREKLKRDLVLCSHDILAASRDSVLSALARHPFYQPEVSSESATTSLKGHTDSCRSRGEIVQRSDYITFDRTVADKRRLMLPMSLDSDQKTDDSSSFQTLHEVKPLERLPFSGKQMPQRLPSSDAKSRKHTETFEKELLMTSDQASAKNQRLPKGFVYVPIRCLSNDKETIPDACSPEATQDNKG